MLRKRRSSPAFEHIPLCYHCSLCVLLKSGAIRAIASVPNGRPQQFTQKKIRWGCEIKHVKPTTRPESEVVADKIRGYKPWYGSRRGPVLSWTGASWQHMQLFSLPVPFGMTVGVIPIFWQVPFLGNQLPSDSWELAQLSGKSNASDWGIFSST